MTLNVILWILTIFFGGWAIVATIIISKQISREDHLIDITNRTVADLEEIDRLIKSSEQVFDNPKLQEAFAHDDEVGNYFKNLKDMQDILYKYVVGDEQDIG